jgi:hypothetical protein
MPRKQRATAVVAHDTKKLETRLAKARTGLVLGHPFFGSLALNMPMTLSDKVKTAATNGKRVLFNPDFIADLTDEELLFLVAHEVCHPMLEHNYRRGERNHKKWNQAGDYVINQLLSDEGIGKMPGMGLLDATLYNAGGGTTDGIFNLLPEPEDDGDGPGDGPGNGPGPLDDCEDAEGDTPAEREQQANDMKVQVAQAAQAAKMMGKLSAGIERLVSEVLQPKVDWVTVLRRFVQKCKNDSRTFARPNRRFVQQGLYLPTISGEAMGELLFAIDCSGSITQRDIDQFAAEIKVVQQDCKPSLLHVVYFDFSVSHYEKYTVSDALDIKPHGGGGTAFSPVFRYMVDHNIKPVAVVFLTDLCCNDFGTPPDCPVLWVSTEDGSAPFGEVVRMR